MSHGFVVEMSVNFSADKSGDRACRNLSKLKEAREELGLADEEYREQPSLREQNLF